MSTKALIGVIGGSGLYQMDALQDVQELVVDTPFGPTSAPVMLGHIEGVPVVFLARHGKEHGLLPSEVPYRANIYALRKLGVRYLISVSAVGSLKAQLQPLDIVLPDQFIDLTKSRVSTFFGSGVIGHVSMAQPICPVLSAILAAAADASTQGAVRVHRGGTYMCIEGPQFSSLAESKWFRQIGADIVGMTNMPEAKLAMEAQMAYATLALITDYDCWHPKEGPVTAELAINNLRKNVDMAKSILVSAIEIISDVLPRSAAHTALDAALVTPVERMSEAGRCAVELFRGSSGFSPTS